MPKESQKIRVLGRIQEATQRAARRTVSVASFFAYGHRQQRKVRFAERNVLKYMTEAKRILTQKAARRLVFEENFGMAESRRSAVKLM